MNRIALILVVFTFALTGLSGLSKKMAAPSATAPSSAVAPSSAISLEKREKLRQLRERIRGWAKVCDDGSLTMSECPFGDMTLFSGLLCLSGETARCEDVRRSQGPTGEWFRSPGMVGNPQKITGATFSRDMSRGVLAYLIATRDREAGERWGKFLTGNDFRLCQKSEKDWSSCDTRLAFWPTMTSVWDFLGLEHLEKMRKWKSPAERFYDPIELRVMPKDDYPIHLAASQLYLRQELAKRTPPSKKEARHLEKMAKILFDRVSDNPFFRYLRFGPDDAGADLVMEACPSTPPESEHRDWIWQRGRNYRHSADGPRVWESPGGHDCIFVINLLIGADGKFAAVRAKKPEKALAVMSVLDDAAIHAFDFHECRYRVPARLFAG